MINLGGLFFLIIAHFVCGRGVMQLFRVQFKPLQTFCLSVIVGIPIISFGPCVLQLMKVPLTKESITAVVWVSMAICCVPLLLHVIKNYKNFTAPKIKLPELYELPFFFVFGILLGVSVWRCYYYPPTAADMINGPELLAKYAVQDKNMISSVFHIDMQVPRYGASNIFKSPFITGLQIVYKLLVQPFGQVWLSVLVLSFITWFYTILKEKIHPLLAGVLMVMFLVIPELYAYTFLMLYDYSTMVFYFIGFYYFTRYMKEERINDLFWGAFLFGISTYIRTETLVLIMMIAPLLAFHYYKKRAPLVSSVINLGVFISFSLVLYFICMKVFVKNFVPITFDLSKQVNAHVTDLSLFFDRFTEISTKLIFTQQGDAYYGPFFYVFLFVLFVDIIWKRKFNKETVSALYGIAMLYLGMAILGHIFPSFSIENTTKRGMFKAMPLAIWYMCNSAALLWISDIITRWENGIKAPSEPKPVAAKVAEAPKAKKK